jgi:hypothetical protein
MSLTTPNCCKCQPTFGPGIISCANVSLGVTGIPLGPIGSFIFTIPVNLAAMTVPLTTGSLFGTYPGWIFNNNVGVFNVGFLGVGASTVAILTTTVPVTITALATSERPTCNPAAATVTASLFPLR